MTTRHRIATLLTLASVAIAGWAFVGVPLAQAQPFTWDGPATGNWSTTTNWDPDGTPGTGDTINIGSGNTVTYDVGDFLPVSVTVNLDGELTRAGTLRWQGSTFNVESTGVISGGFRDLDNGTLTFDDGAQFTASAWENKGTNVFNFNLGASGFSTLTPGTLFVSGGASAMVNATYTADLASYTGGTGIITLVDYSGNFHNIDNADFQTATLNTVNTGADTARLFWDDATFAIKLNVNPTTTWDGGGADGAWKTGTNWTGGPDNEVPVANDNVVINNGDTVEWDSTGGDTLPGNLNVTLSGNSELTVDGVIRLNNATMTVESGSSLTSIGGGFWDLDDADITFEDGAIATMAFWENKDINTFTFNLGATGFSTLTPTNFLIGNGTLTGDIANATYNVDLANYTGGIGIITLVDYTADLEGMDNLTFQGAGGLNILNAGLYTANLQWNDSLEAIELNITAVIPEPSTFALMFVGLAGLCLGGRRRRRRR